MDMQEAIKKAVELRGRESFYSDIEKTATLLLECYEAGKTEYFANRLLLTREELAEFEADYKRMDAIRKACQKLSNGFLCEGVRWEAIPADATLDEWLDASLAEAKRRCGEDEE